MTAERIKLVHMSQWARQFLRDRLEGCPWVYINDRRLQWFVCNYDLGVRFYITPDGTDPNWEIYRRGRNPNGVKNVI